MDLVMTTSLEILMSTREQLSWVGDGRERASENINEQLYLPRNNESDFSLSSRILLGKLHGFFLPLFRCVRQLCRPWLQSCPRLRPPHGQRWLGRTICQPVVWGQCLVCQVHQSHRWKDSSGWHLYPRAGMLCGIIGQSIEAFYCGSTVWSVTSAFLDFKEFSKISATKLTSEINGTEE